MSAPSSYNVLLVRADGVEAGRDAAVARLAEHFRLAHTDAERIVDSVPVVVRKGASDDESRRLVARLREMGFEARRIPAGDTTSQRPASITGILKPVHTSKERLRRLSGQFSVIDDAAAAAARRAEAAEDAGEWSGSASELGDALASTPGPVHDDAADIGPEAPETVPPTRGGAPQETHFERGPLDVDVEARTLAPPSALDGLLTSNDADSGVLGSTVGPQEAAGPGGGPASTPSPTSALDGAARGGLDDTEAAFELTGNRHDDTPEPAGVDPELTRALDEIAADLPSEHPWPDVTGLSEIPVQTPRGPAPPPPVAGEGGRGPDDTANLTDVARRSSVLDEMMAIDDDGDDGFAETPSIEDVIAGNAPIPSAPRRSADVDDEVADDELHASLTHASLEDSLSDISGAQERGSTAPTPAVGAGRITGPSPRVPERRSKGPGGGVGILIVVAIVVVLGGIGAAVWWTLQERASDAWRFAQAPRHYEQVEMIDGVRASSACAVLEPGRELCRYASEHVASWFPSVDAAVIEAAADTCHATAQRTSTDRRVVFDCTVRIDRDGARETWSLVHEHTRECSAPPGGLQQGESAECVERIERRASRDGTAAVAPFTDQQTSVWTFDRLRESFSTNVGYFRVAELRVRPSDAASGLPVLVAWALDIDRVVERYRPDGTMIEEIVYIHDPTRRVGTPILSPAAQDAP